MKVYQQISLSINGFNTCSLAKKHDLASIHLKTIKEIEDNFLPLGNGVDNGCRINILKSGKTKIQIDFDFHHMENGKYIKWTTHRVIVTPLFVGVDLKIKDQGIDNMEEYFYDLFYSALVKEFKTLN